MSTVDMKQTIVSALCHYLSLDAVSFTDESDLKALCTNILKSSQNGNNYQLMKWIEFTEKFSENVDSSLKSVNEELVTKTVVASSGFTPTAADVIVFAALHSSLIGLSATDRAKLPHLFRWADYIQNKVEFGKLFEKIPVEKVPSYYPQASKPVKKTEDSNAKKPGQVAKEASSSQVDSNLTSNAKKSAQDVISSDADSKATRSNAKKVEASSKAVTDKKKAPEKEAEKKDEELSVSLLKIQIGLIRKAWKHPSADSLLVEEIDIGEDKCRQVVSGLAKYCTPEELTNRLVVLITNVKPGKLRDIMSQGLVLCASSQDHSVVQPLAAPEGAKPGELVTFSGLDGKPEDVLNPKKKQLDKITPNLFTDDKGVATFKSIPFMTSAGPCTSSIVNGTIK